MSETNSLEGISFPTDHDQPEGEHVWSPSSSSSSSRQNKRRRLSPRLQYSFNESKYHVPQFVSSWKLYHAERLHIFYAKCYTETPNDLFLLLGRIIEPFSDQQKYYIKRIKSFLNFETGEPGISGNRATAFLKDIYIKLEPVFDKIIKELRSILDHGNRAKDSHPDYYHIDVLASYRVFEFIEELSNLLKLFQVKYREGEEVSETYYISVCQSFAQMCHLKVQSCRPTSKWKGLADQKLVSSIPDLRFYQKGKQLDGLVLSKSQILVSVVEVKKDSWQKSEEPPNKIGKWLDEKDEDSCRPEILNDLSESVLGRHAGELLLEIRFDHVKKVENGVYKFMIPGMIVDGTKVYFTILKMSGDHIEELEKKKSYCDNMDKATIYYSKPLDLIVKKDRDILIDSFMMLNNIDFT